MKPISFKDALVIEIEEDRKTHTRRLLKDAAGAPPPPWAGFRRWCGDIAHFDVSPVYSAKPRFYVDDHLWVKQRLFADDADRVCYGTRVGRVMIGGRTVPWPWKPRILGAMYCPRWASRLTLEVVEVRVERVAEISEEDALAEGISEHESAFAIWPPPSPTYRVPGDSKPRYSSAVAAFAALWDSIHGDDKATSWAASPWVWVYVFRRGCS